MSKAFLSTLVLCFLASGSALAQYGPPLGGGGFPVPWGHKKKNQQKKNEPSLAADGTTLSNNGKTLVMATGDGRTLTLTIEADTKFTRSGSPIAAAEIVPRSRVHVEAAEDEEAYLTALTVELVKDPSAAAQAPAAVAEGNQVQEKPSTVVDTPVDVPDRPILRRGKPPANEEASSAPPVSSSTRLAKRSDGTDFTIESDDAPSTKAANSASEALISRTKQWSETFTNGLPNFVCQQSTTRYMEESKSAGWQALDVITAKVVYEDGKENYREITVGGKRTNKSMLDLGGSTSTGEFASTLYSLFSDASQAQFKFYRSATVGETPAAIYDFKVALHNSDWLTKIGGQALKPAYSGSVWIDRSTAQVRRIEMQGENIPKDFPLDSLQWAVDYDNVRLGTAAFLLPVHAENLYCQRGSTVCFKNEIDFRDYHKFSGESTITFDK